MSHSFDAQTNLSFVLVFSVRGPDGLKGERGFPGIAGKPGIDAAKGNKRDFAKCYGIWLNH